MKMISYWKSPVVIYDDDGLILIVGFYDHKNANGGGSKALGIHWGTYPQSRGVLSPCVIPEKTRNSMLAGLLFKATEQGDAECVNKIVVAIDFFQDESKCVFQLAPV